MICSSTLLEMNNKFRIFFPYLKAYCFLNTFSLAVTFYIYSEYSPTYNTFLIENILSRANYTSISCNITSIRRSVSQDNARPHFSNCLYDTLIGKNLSTDSTHCSFAFSIAGSVIHWINLRHGKTTLSDVAECEQATHIAMAQLAKFAQENKRGCFMSQCHVALLHVWKPERVTTWLTEIWTSMFPYALKLRTLYDGHTGCKKSR